MNAATYLTRACAAQRAARASMMSSALAARAAVVKDAPEGTHPLAALGRPEREDLGSRVDAAA